MSKEARRDTGSELIVPMHAAVMCGALLSTSSTLEEPQLEKMRGERARGSRELVSLMNALSGKPALGYSR